MTPTFWHTADSRGAMCAFTEENAIAQRDTAEELGKVGLGGFERRFHDVEFR